MADTLELGFTKENILLFSLGLLIGVPICIVIIYLLKGNVDFSQILPKAQPKAAPETTSTTVMENKEVWTWVDYKGNQRELVVHREVKRPSRPIIPGLEILL